MVFFESLKFFLYYKCQIILQKHKSIKANLHIFGSSQDEALRGVLFFVLLLETLPFLKLNQQSYVLKRYIISTKTLIQ